MSNFEIFQDENQGDHIDTRMEMKRSVKAFALVDKSNDIGIANDRVSPILSFCFWKKVSLFVSNSDSSKRTQIQCASAGLSGWKFPKQFKGKWKGQREFDWRSVDVNWVYGNFFSVFHVSLQQNLIRYLLTPAFLIHRYRKESDDQLTTPQSVVSTPWSTEKSAVKSEQVQLSRDLCFDAVEYQKDILQYLKIVEVCLCVI